MKLKVYRFRALLIFIALFIPNAILTALYASGTILGGIGTVILYTPFFYFIFGIVLKGKIGPKLPPEPTNDSQPITPEMLASDRISANETDFVSDEDMLYHLCPRCDTPVPIHEGRCLCGRALPSNLPEYRLCPECNSIIPKSTQVCSCGHHFT